MTAMRVNRHIAILAALTSLLLATAASCGGPGAESGEGTRRRSTGIVETGTLEAVRTKAFIMPRAQYNFGAMRVVGLIEHGAMVQAGDSLMQLDPSGLNRYILDREASLENELAAKEKLIVTNENRIRELESSIANEQASFDLKRIEVEATAFESERTRRVKELEFEQARINLAQNRRRLELAHVMNENDMKIQNIRLEQIESDLRNVDRIRSEYTIRTTVNGVFQVGMNYRSYPNLLKVGDEVYQGQPLGNVPELEHMKVTTFVNENDFLKVTTGQSVAIRLDATPDVVFDGRVSYIGRLCRPRDPGSASRQKGFDVEVEVMRPDERLKPGMTVSCEFLATDDR
jgi:multidrug efflux pump subunit AcrA (membrane-fusion protein)